MAIRTEDDKQIGHHSRFSFIIEFDDFVAAQVLESLLHHTYRTLDNLGSSCDDGRRLLSLQHRGCDFCSVGKMTDSRLDDFHACFIDALLDIVLQLVADLLSIAAQRDFVVVAIVRMSCCQVSQGSFALHTDIILVIIDFKESFRGVDNTPHDDGGDFDWVSIPIVDLRWSPVRAGFRCDDDTLFVFRFSYRSRAVSKLRTRSEIDFFE